MDDVRPLRLAPLSKESSLPLGLLPCSSRALRGPRGRGRRLQPGVGGARAQEGAGYRRGAAAEQGAGETRGRRPLAVSPSHTPGWGAAAGGGPLRLPLAFFPAPGGVAKLLQPQRPG